MVRKIARMPNPRHILYAQRLSTELTPPRQIGLYIIEAVTIHLNLVVSLSYATVVGERKEWE